MESESKLGVELKKNKYTWCFISNFKDDRPSGKDESDRISNVFQHK